MSSRRILVPVYGALDAADIVRNSFWLARHQPAELYLVEVIPPPGFVRWLLAPIRRIIKKSGSRRLRQAQHRAIDKEHLDCNIAELQAPSLVLGIVEASWKVQADTIILAPELHEGMGKAGLSDLKNRLSEMGQCLLIILRRGPSMRVEPLRKKELLDFGRVVPFNRG